MIKHTFFKYISSILTLLTLIICVSCLRTINCEDYTPYIDKLTVPMLVEKSLKEGTGDCYIGTPNGDVAYIQNGKIVNYDIVYQAGITDAQIAEWSARNKKATTQQSATNNTESSNKVEEKAPKNNNAPKEDTVKKPSYTEEEIAAAWEETDRVESTCTEAGHVSYTNSLTGETKSEELPLAEHKYSEIERKDSTCSEAGSITYTCEVCGDTYTEEIPALNHEYEWVTTKEATLFTPGEEQYVCKNCGDASEIREVKATCPIPIVAVSGIIMSILAVCCVLFYKRKHK